MQEENTFERFLDILCVMKEPMLPDQDVLNLACKGRVTFLHSAWNCLEWMDPKKLHEARILHFAGKKPWDFRYSSGSGSCYWAYSRLSPAQLHQRVVDAFHRQSAASTNIKSFFRLAFHLARCIVLPPFTNAFRKEKFARKKRYYLLEMRALLRLWRSRATLRFPIISFPVERRALSRSGTLLGNPMPECLEVATK